MTLPQKEYPHQPMGALSDAARPCGGRPTAPACPPSGGVRPAARGRSGGAQGHSRPVPCGFRPHAAASLRPGMRRVSPRLSSATAPRAGPPPTPPPVPGASSAWPRTCCPTWTHGWPALPARAPAGPCADTALTPPCLPSHGLPAPGGGTRLGPGPHRTCATGTDGRCRKPSVTGAPPCRGCTALASRRPAPALGVDRSDGGSPAGHREAPPSGPCYLFPYCRIYPAVRPADRTTRGSHS